MRYRIGRRARPASTVRPKIITSSPADGFAVLERVPWLEGADRLRILDDEGPKSPGATIRATIDAFRRPARETRRLPWTHPMATNRNCGTCTLCCKVLEIAELNKPMGSWCAKCKPGVGCTIHDHKPAECTTFNWAYLSSPSETREGSGMVTGGQHSDRQFLRRRVTMED